MQRELNIPDKTVFHAVLLFFLWPLLAVVSAFKNYRKNWSVNIFWAFCAFYGLVFAFGGESAESDIVRYTEELQFLHGKQMSVSEAFTYYQNSGEVDVLRTFIAITLSRLTDIPNLLTLIYGVIFGYFFSRNFWFVLNRLEGHLLPITLLLLTCFFFVNPIWKINTFRMWTAAHIFLYGLLPLLFDGDKKKMAWCFASLLVHFSFIVPVVMLIVYIIGGNRIVLYTVFFICSIFVSEINIEVFNHLVESYAPEMIQERSSSYRSEAQVEAYREGPEEARNWYVDWYRRAFGWSLIGFLLVIFFAGRHFFEKNSGWMNLYCFSVLFYGIANIFSSLPSGGRYLTLAHLAAMSLIILYVQNQTHDKWLKRFSIVSLPALLLYLVVSIRIAFYTLSATAVIGNPIVGVFTMGGNISLNDVMRMIL